MNKNMQEPLKHLVVTPHDVAVGDITITLSEYGVSVHLGEPNEMERFLTLCKKYGLEVNLEELDYPVSVEGGAVLVSGALLLASLPLILGAGVV